MTPPRVDFDDVVTEDDLKVTLDGRAFTGEVVERARSGQVVALTTYSNGIEDGPSAEWYPSGERKATGSVSWRMAVGVHVEWHRNGRLAAQDEFDDRGGHLSLRRWDESGTLVEERVFTR